MLFEEKKQERRLEHVLKKYAKLANSNPRKLLSQLPKKEYWRFFIDGIRQQSARGIRKALIKAHGKEMLMDDAFLSKTINEYRDEYEFIFTIDDEPIIFDQFLAYKLYLSKSEYYAFLKIYLDSGMATMRDVLQLDQAWVAFEINEPHYLFSTLKAFLAIQHSKEELSVELVKKTHALLGATVSGTNYDGHSRNRPGEFRNTQLYAYGMIKDNTSLFGITEMLKRKNKANVFIFTINSDAYYQRYRVAINHHTISNFRKHGDISAIIPVDENGNPEWKLIDAKEDLFDQVIVNIFTLICEAKSREEIAALIYSLINGTFKFSQFDLALPLMHLSFEMRYAYLVPEDNIQSFYEGKLQQLIDNYSIDIERANSQFEKLRVIVTFTQLCEQLHPFLDMNCRLFCMVLLNHLLAQNGFPYVIQADPNRFDLYSIDELIDDMITGMQKTFELIEKKAVYGVDTRLVLKELKESPTHRSTFYAELNETLAWLEETLKKPAPQSTSTPRYNN